MYVTPIGYGFPKIYSHLECNSSELLNIFNSGFFSVLQISLIFCAIKIMFWRRFFLKASQLFLRFSSKISASLFLQFLKLGFLNCIRLFQWQKGQEGLILSLNDLLTETKEFYCVSCHQDNKIYNQAMTSASQVLPSWQQLKKVSSITRSTLILEKTKCENLWMSHLFNPLLSMILAVVV